MKMPVIQEIYHFLPFLWFTDSCKRKINGLQISVMVRLQIFEPKVCFFSGHSDVPEMIRSLYHPLNLLVWF